MHWTDPVNAPGSLFEISSSPIAQPWDWVTLAARPSGQSPALGRGLEREKLSTTPTDVADVMGFN